MKIDDFDKWLKDLVYPREFEDFVEIVEDVGQGDQDGYEIKKIVNLYTDHHKYYFVAIEREDESKGYLGCQVSARKPRAGETWTRGNDLPDGELSEKTLEQIKNAIVAYELVPLSVRVPPRPIRDMENGGSHVKDRSKTGMPSE